MGIQKDEDRTWGPNHDMTCKEYCASIKKEIADAGTTKTGGDKELPDSLKVHDTADSETSDEIDASDAIKVGNQLRKAIEEVKNKTDLPPELALMKAGLFTAGNTGWEDAGTEQPTTNYGKYPSMSDDVIDQSGKRCGHVSDWFESQLPHYKEVNESLNLNKRYRKSTAEESLNKIVSDIPKSMVDKIVAIPGDEWDYLFVDNHFTAKYVHANRSIIISVNMDRVPDMTRESESSIPESDEHNDYFLEVYYSSTGISYRKNFDTPARMYKGNANTKRLFTLVYRMIDGFFTK